MTAGANLTEIIGHVIRVGSALKIGLMTSVTGGRGVYVTGRMAGNTSQRGMGSGQGEGGSAMIECRRQPGGGGVTAGADLAEIIGHVIRVGSALKIGLMAGIACRRCVHVTGCVAGNTSQRGMGSGQGEGGSAMIEGRRQPGGGSVAIRASLIEII